MEIFMSTMHWIKSNIVGNKPEFRKVVVYDDVYWVRVDPSQFRETEKDATWPEYLHDKLLDKFIIRWDDLIWCYASDTPFDPALMGNLEDARVRKNWIKSFTDVIYLHNGVYLLQ
jgi:hypothetical protein